jgi:hypothetical protein
MVHWFRHFIPACVLTLFLFTSCKETNHDPQGEDLPAQHIILSDSTFTPEQVTITNGGGAVRFVNPTDSTHTIRSNDATFFSVVLAPYQTYYYRPDTIVSGPLNIPYYCEEHPYAQGVITIMP